MLNFIITCTVVAGAGFGVGYGARNATYGFAAASFAFAVMEERRPLL